MKVLTLLLLVGCTGCPPQPTSLPPLSDAAAASVETTCQHLVTVGCYPTSATCFTGIGNMVQTGLAPIDLACAMDAGSRDAASLCVGVSCPGSS
jgi:hypothetical protein